MKPIKLIFVMVLAVFFSMFFSLKVNATSVTLKNPIEEIQGTKKIYSVDDYTFLIDENDSLWAWGKIQMNTRNQYYELEVARKIAVNVKELYIQGNFLNLKGLYYKSNDNVLYSLGKYDTNNIYYNDTGMVFYDSPHPILEDLKSFHIYENTYFAVQNDGDLYGWGSGGYGLFGSKVDFISEPSLLRTGVEKVFFAETDYETYFLYQNKDLAMLDDEGEHILATNVNDFCYNSSKRYYLTTNGEVYRMDMDYITFDIVSVKVLDNIRELKYIRDGSLHNEQYSSWNTTYAISNDNELYSWGINWDGTIGNGTVDVDLYTPFHLMSDVSEVYINRSQTFIKKINSDLYGVGLNDQDSLGTGDGLDHFEPVYIMSDVKTLIPSYSQNYVIKNDNSLWVWGNFVLNRYPKTPLFVMDNVRDVSAINYDYAITTEGALYSINAGYYFPIIRNNTSAVYKIFEPHGNLNSFVRYPDDLRSREIITIDSKDNTKINLSYSTKPTTIMPTGYEVYRSTDNQYFNLVGYSYLDTYYWTTTFTDYGTNGSYTYYYKLRPFYNYKELNYGEVITRMYGYESNSIQTTTPFEMSLVTQQRQGKYVNISWNETEEITGYEIYFKNPTTAQYELLDDIDVNSYITDFEVEFSYKFEFKILPYKMISGSKSYGKPEYSSKKYSYYTLSNNLTVDYTYINSYEFTWIPLDKISYYELWRNDQVIYSGNNLSYIDDITQVDETSFRYYLIAVYNDGKNTYKNWSNDFILNKESISATLTIDQDDVIINWDQYDQIKDTEVLRSSTLDFSTYNVIGTSTNETFTDVGAASSNYYYMLRYSPVYDNSVYLNYSKILSNLTDLIAPDISVSDVGLNYISLTWNEVKGATDYEVYRSDTENGTYVKISSTNDLFYTNNNLTLNKKYFYKVIALNSSDANLLSPFSNTVYATTSFNPPANLNITAVSSSSTSISWNSVIGAAGYEVHYSKGTSTTYTLLKSQTVTTPVLQTGLTANTVYNYKVRAYRMSGTTKVYSAFTEVKSITTPPSTPILKVVSKNSDTLSLSWAAVPGATQFELYQNSILIDSLASSVLSKDISGLELGSSYKYTLVALNGELRSAYSVEVTGIPVPAAVGNLKFSEVRFNGFSLDWDEVEGADHYDVFQGTTSTAVTTKVGSVTDSNFTTSTLLNFNTSYYYKVVPVTLSGLNGTASMILTGKTAISAPSGVSVSALSGSSTSVTYEAVNGAAGYEVHFSKGTSITYTLLKAQTTVTPVIQTGLTANTVYNYKVRAYRMASTTKVYSTFSEVKSITTPPSTPVLKVVSKNSDTLSLSWAAVPGATQFELYQNSVLIETLASSVLSKDISGLELGSSYKYTLVALNGELRSAYSVEVTGTPVPAAVGNLKFSEVRFNGFSLDWDEVSGADHYDVFQGTSSTAVTTKVGSVTDSSFTTTTLLIFNTSYYYKVVPVTLSGLNGTASMIITGKTAISAPSGLSVSALSGSSTSVSYEAVNGAAGYEVHFSKDTSLTYNLLKAQTTVTPVVQTGLTANTVYNYKVRAYRMAGTTKVYSAFSEVKSITTPPSTPLLKVMSKNSDTLSLSWAVVPGATQYELYQNSVLIETLASSVLSKDISGLELGSSYKYTLVALNGELRSAYSVEVTGIPVPAAVGNLKFSEVRFNGFSLDWDEVAGADHYDVFQGTTSTAVTTKVGSVTDSQFSTTALLNFNTSYYYNVVPVTLSGLNGTASMILTGKTAISAPSGVSVSALSGSSTSVSYEVVNGAAGYEIYFSKGTSLTYTLLKAQTTVTPVVQTGLTANTVYNYKVRAYRMVGTIKVYGAFSEVKSITTPPSTPIINIMSKNSDTLGLYWSPVPGATQYELYQNSVLLETFDSTVLSKDISGLELGSTYKFSLIALNGELRSATSVEVTGMPVPASVDNLMFTEIRFNGFSIDWNEVTGADHYDVFQGTSSTAVTTKVGSVTDSSFTTTTLLNFNTSYYYKVVPVTLSGLNGTASMILTGKTAISAPSGVSVSSLSGSSTSVTYEAVDGAAGYEVHFSKGTSITYTLLKAQTTVTPVVQTGLTANTVYNYKVRAYRMAGTTKVYGAFSEVKSITTPPSTPVLKVISKNSDTLSLSWAAVPGATSYEVYKDNSLLDTVNSSVLSLDVNSLNVGQTYGFYCVALNGELRSSNSIVVNGVPVPGAVSNFKVVDTQYNGFTLDWDGVSGSDHYDVFQGTTSTTVTTKLASVTESEYKTTASLNFNASYYYKVVPVTSGGLNGTASNILTAKTALAKPLNVLGDYLTNTSIELNWDAVSGAAGYEISYSKGTSTTFTVLRSVTTLSTTHTGLTENSAYNYRVRAYRMSGTVKLYSAYSDLTTPVSKTYEAINLLEYNDITSLDIHLAIDSFSWNTFANTMEGLVSLSKVAGEVESGVASSWSFDETTKTWTFNLNPNAVWVNNQGVIQRSVTASDFVYAWDRLNANTDYPYNYYLQYMLYIESYQAVNATTLKVKVTEYQPYFLNSLIKPVLFPMAPENVSTFGAEYGNSNNSVWYNGAYYLSSWNRDVNTKWTKNNKYWNAGIVKTPEINIKFETSGDLSAELNEFDSGLIDLIRVSGSDYVSRKNDNNLELFPDIAMFYLFINSANNGMINGSTVIDESAGNPLFDNQKIRQAIAYYLDKQSLLDSIPTSPFIVANHFVPNSFISYNGNAFESSRGSGYMLKNQELARSLFVEGMSELGYSEGDNSLIIEFLNYESTNVNIIVDKIISDLNILFSGYGITINKKSVPFDEYFSNVDNGLYEISYMGWGQDYLWPTTYLNNYLSYSTYNNVGYNNSMYDDLLNPSGKTKSKIWTDLQLAEKVLLEDANIIPISQRVIPRLVNSRLKGISMNYSEVGLYYKWIYKE